MSWYEDFIDSSNAKNAARSEIRQNRVKKEEVISREKILEEALKAAEDIIGWYEMEHERSSYEESELPEDLKELEEVFNTAKARLK